MAGLLISGPKPCFSLLSASRFMRPSLPHTTLTPFICRFMLLFTFNKQHNKCIENMESVLAAFNCNTIQHLNVKDKDMGYTEVMK